MAYRGDVLHEFISLNRAEIIERCRAKVASRLIPTPTESEINHGVPLFLDQVIQTLQHHHQTSGSEIGKSAALHGHDLLKRGFTVGQVVHDYGDVCQSITEIAVATNAPIGADEFRTLNRCLDDAIADAVTAYGADRQESSVAEESARGTARLGFFIHELRNLIQTAAFASEVLLKGNVGLAGSTAAVLRRSLVALQSLVDQSIADVRLTRGTQHPQVLSVSKFAGEIAAAATLQAASRNVAFRVVSAKHDAEILGDQQHLAAALNNLLQNAFKFTRPGSTVTLKITVSIDRILLEVHDECGGLADGQSAELFHPFEQRGSDRSGLGLGLAYSQWAVVANGGRLYVRNLPPIGCVFVVDLLRHIRSTEQTTAAHAATHENATDRRSKPDRRSTTTTSA
jgi:signal transduction histidine kinase